MGYFVSQSLATDTRRECEDALKRTYHDGLTSRGIDYPRDEFDGDYRRTIAFCFIYPIVAAGQIEVTSDRHRSLVTDMVTRAIQAIEDNDALDVLP
jgi:hypothetical protein